MGAIVTNRFEQMRAFAGVVESGGFSKSTQRTGMSRAVVSRHVLELEDRLGARLLNRTTRQVNLTETGQIFYEKCRRLLDELEEAERGVSGVSAGPQGRLRVVAPINFGLADLGPAVAEFLLEYTEIKIELSLNDHQIDPIESGYDIAIRVRQSAPALPMTLDAATIARSTRILCASKDYLNSHNEPQHPDDLRQHSCLSYSYVDDPAVWELERDGTVFNVPIQGRIVTSAGPVLATAAERGLGIAYGPKAFFREPLASGTVRQILSDYSLPRAGVYSLYERSRHVPEKIVAFNRFMKEFFTGRIS